MIDPCETLKKLNDLRKRKEYCDVVLIVEGQEFHCHRAILVTAVEYFRKMFGGRFRQNQSPSVQLKNVSQTYFDKFLEYIYTGEVEITELSSAEHLLIFSSYFSVDCLMGKCIEYIESNMDIGEALNFHLLAEKIGCTSLKEFTTKFIGSNFSAIATTESFLELPFSIVNELISSDSTFVEDEEFIFETINKWIRYDPANRKEYFPDLFEKIRFKFVNSDYITNDVLANDLVVKYARSCVQVISAKDGCEPRVSGSSKLIYLFGRRNTKDRSYKIGVVCWNGSKFDDVRRMDWIGYDTESVSAVCHDNSLHIFVNSNSDPYFGYFGNDKWISLKTPSDKDKCIGNLVSSGNSNRIYANSYDDVCYYDSDDGIWNTLIAEGYTDDDSRIKIEGAALVCWENSLFSIGGWNTSMLKVYDSRVRTWQSRTDVPELVDYSFRFATLNDDIYATGSERNVLIYDIRKDNWRSGSKMKHTPYLHCLVGCDNKLYAISAHVCDRYYTVINIYDPVVDEWSFGPLLDPFTDECNIIGVSCNEVY